MDSAAEIAKRMELLQTLGKPLRIYSPANTIPKAQEWLYNMGIAFAEVGDLTDKEKVSVCLSNLTDDIADQAYDHDTFESYDAFKKWMCDFLGMDEKPLSMTNTLKSTVQVGHYSEYAGRFRAIWFKNKRCEYPRAPIEISEIFLENMRNKPLQAQLLPLVKTKSFLELMDQGHKLIEKGVVPDIWQHTGLRSRSGLQTKSKDISILQRNLERRTDMYRPESRSPESRGPESRRTDIDRSGYDKPEYDRPEYDRPDFERPVFERPDFDRPGYDRPDFERPGSFRPGHIRPDSRRHLSTRPASTGSEFRRPESTNPHFNRPESIEPDLFRRSTSPKRAITVTKQRTDSHYSPEQKSVMDLESRRERLAKLATAGSPPVRRRSVHDRNGENGDDDVFDEWLVNVNKRKRRA